MLLEMKNDEESCGQISGSASDWLIDRLINLIGSDCIVLNFIGLSRIGLIWTEFNETEWLIVASFITPHWTWLQYWLKMLDFPQASKITPFQAQLAVSIDYDMTNEMILNQCFRRTHESCCFQNPLPTKNIYLTKKFRNLSCELYPWQSSPCCFSRTCEHLKFAGTLVNWWDLTSSNSICMTLELVLN